MMRIIQIGQFPLDSALIRGGVESSINGLARELSKHHEVFVMDIPRMGIDDSIEQCDAIRVYRFRNKGKHQRDSAKRIDEICSIISEIKPSVCHIHGTSFFSWKMYRSLTRQGIPALVTVHGLVSVEKKKALQRRFSLKGFYQYFEQSNAERKLLNSVQRVIVDTKYVADALPGYHLKHIPRTIIIPQGIDQHFFSMSCTSFSHEILSVGAISRRKGHHLLIQSFELLCEKIHDVHLTVCGNLTDKDYLDELMLYVSNSPHKNQISLVTDASKDDLDCFFQHAGLFVLHSQEESQGIVLAEAMATGLPIVATRVGGIPDVVDENRTGLLVEYGDILGFADAMSSLLLSREKWATLSDACRSAANRFSWQGIASRIEALYEVLSINKD